MGRFTTKVLKGDLLKIKGLLKHSVQEEVDEEFEELLKQDNIH